MSKVLVIGLGVSGRSAVRFLLNRDFKVWGVDRRPGLAQSDEQVAQLCREGLQVVEEEALRSIDMFDQVVVSPGVPKEHPLYHAAIKAKIPVLGEIELACRQIKQPFLAVTGTNGKTTVTLLIAHVLNHLGKPAKALGNIGVPLTAEIDQSQNEILVVELSSYQLETLSSRVVDAGIILNITPDHLDRYTTLADYAAAKIHLKECLKPGGILYIERRIYDEFAPLFGKEIPNFYEELFTLDLDPRMAPHDRKNALGAYALCHHMGVSAEQFVGALNTFKKPPHRIEFVANVRGVDFYNDSKGTNIDAVVRAVQAIPGKMVLIAGGVDKGASYTPWIQAFADKVKYVCAIGEAADLIRETLAPAYPVQRFSSLEDAIFCASSLAKPGENVLLSPGCSSFDMFRDYVHRGEEFKRIVNML